MIGSTGFATGDSTKNWRSRCGADGGGSIPILSSKRSLENYWQNRLVSVFPSVRMFPCRSVAGSDALCTPEPYLPAFLSRFAWRFSFADLVAGVLAARPPLSLPAMEASL